MRITNESCYNGMVQKTRKFLFGMGVNKNTITSIVLCMYRKGDRNHPFTFKAELDNNTDFEEAVSIIRVLMAKRSNHKHGRMVLRVSGSFGVHQVSEELPGIIESKTELRKLYKLKGR